LPWGWPLISCSARRGSKRPSLLVLIPLPPLLRLPLLNLLMWICCCPGFSPRFNFFCSVLKTAAASRWPSRRASQVAEHRFWQVPRVSCRPGLRIAQARCRRHLFQGGAALSRRDVRPVAGFRAWGISLAPPAAVGCIRPELFFAGQGHGPNKGNKGHTGKAAAAAQWARGAGVLAADLAAEVI